MFSIFVFSYNRGHFLRNCLESIMVCAPMFPTVIFDDTSSDAYTIEVLKDASEHFEVITPSVKCGTVQRLGGLYGNMNFALDIAEARGDRYVVFLQDDMQFVRNIYDSDLLRIENFFQHAAKSIQYQACFRRKNWRKSYMDSVFYDESSRAFFVPESVETGSFSAVGVFEIDRTRSLLGEFAEGEGKNGELCRRLGIRTGISSFPFMNWLPYPSSFRGRRRTLEHKCTELLGGAGFHPISLMTAETQKRFFAKAADELPIAEDWLFAPSSPRHDVWSTGGGKMNVRARGGVRLSAFRALSYLKGVSRNFL